jgi:hypothetical protein
MWRPAIDTVRRVLTFGGGRCGDAGHTSEVHLPGHARQLHDDFDAMPAAGPVVLLVGELAYSRSAIWSKEVVLVSSS